MILESLTIKHYAITVKKLETPHENGDKFATTLWDKNTSEDCDRQVWLYSTESDALAWAFKLACVIANNKK